MCAGPELELFVDFGKISGPICELVGNGGFKYVFSGFIFRSFGVTSFEPKSGRQGFSKRGSLIFVAKKTRSQNCFVWSYDYGVFCRMAWEQFF